MKAHCPSNKRKTECPWRRRTSAELIRPAAHSVYTAWFSAKGLQGLRFRVYNI